MLPLYELVESTQAETFVVPSETVHGDPEPTLAVTVVEAPGGREAVVVAVPAMKLFTVKSTLFATPAGVAPAPMFLMTALNVTASPLFGLTGFAVMSVTTRSGLGSGSKALTV